jgi:hypothetical protein
MPTFPDGFFLHNLEVSHATLCTQRAPISTTALYIVDLIKSYMTSKGFVCHNKDNLINRCKDYFPSC